MALILTIGLFSIAALMTYIAVRGGFSRD